MAKILRRQRRVSLASARGALNGKSCRREVISSGGHPADGIRRESV